MCRRNMIGFLLLALVGSISTIAGAETLSLAYRGEGIYAGMKSQGGVLNYRPSPNLGLSYSVMYGEDDLRGDVVATRTDDLRREGVEASPLMVHEGHLTRRSHEFAVRWYPLGGSFFMAAGASLGNYTARYRDESMEGDEGIQYQATTHGATFSLGNLWVRHYMVLGFEWVGVSHNLSRKETFDRSEEGTTAEQRIFRNSVYERTDFRSSLTLAMFHFGLAF